MEWFSKSGLQKSALQIVPTGAPTVFTHLAGAWKEQHPVPWPSAKSQPTLSVPAGAFSFEQVTLIHSSTKRQEAALVAGEIRRLVREEHLRYRDIFIAAAGLDSSSAIIRATFQEAAIPYYLDEKKSLGRTALARTIQSLLELCLYNWSHRALMKYARCGLCSATQREIDEFETFLLSRGIKWKSQIFDDMRFDRDWVPTPADPSVEESGDSPGVKPGGKPGQETVPDSRQMTGLRDRLCKNVLAFEKSCGQSRTGGQYCEALRHFLQAEEIAPKIDRICDGLLREKQEDAATAMVKAWNELLHLLEQIEQICGDTPMDLALFRGILQNGMEKAVSGTIPSAVDQVHLASADQIGERQRPVLFVIGMSEGAYPEKLSSEGLLKDREREAFSDYFGVSIPSAVSDKYYEDMFRTYSLLSLPTGRLYLSCPEPEDRESNVISFVRECVPDCRKLSWSEQPGPFDVQIFSARTAFHTLVSMTGTPASGAPAHSGWARIRQGLLRSPESGERLLALEGRLKVSQTKILLSKEKILSRYRDPVAMSVSQLETYGACSYSHFAKYLLKLKPRVTWDVKSSETGSLLHGIVEIAVRQFLEEYNAASDAQEKTGVLARYQSMDFEDFTFEKMKEVIQRDKMGAFLDKGFFASKGRTSCRLAASTLQAVFGQFLSSGFLPAILEWEFSPQNGNALGFSLPGSPPLSFHGKVDRIDLDGSYFRVIDYKSGNQNVDFDRWYHGLSLQLPAYIAAFAGQYPGMKPGEAAYMQFMRPILLYDSGSVSEIDQKHEQNMKKQYQLRSTGMEPDDLSAAARHAVGRMKDLSFGLLNGEYDIRPKKTGKEAPCDYCEFMSICGFESKYDKFTVLEPLGKMRDEQGKALPKSAVFIKKITGEGKV
jgi:ATP-dependent helicase/nuclease subunit B